MRVLNSKAARLASLFAMVCQLSLGPPAWAGEADAVIERGALAHAVTALEDSFGGKVLDIRLADEKGAAAFEAALAKDDGVLYLRIAAISDDVTQIKLSELPPWLLNYRIEAYTRSIEKAKVPLAEAILKAETRASAPAIGAGLAKPLSGTNAVLAYYVEVIKGSKRDILALDAKDDAFIANPESLYEPFTPVKLARRLAE